MGTPREHLSSAVPVSQAIFVQFPTRLICCKCFLRSRQPARAMAGRKGLRHQGALEDCSAGTKARREHQDLRLRSTRHVQGYQRRQEEPLGPGRARRLLEGAWIQQGSGVQVLKSRCRSNVRYVCLLSRLRYLRAPRASLSESLCNTNINNVP
jgi:hypothetical protein